MQNITNAAELKNVIQLLQEEELIKRQLLKEQLNLTFESLKPINLLKKTVKDISTSPELMDNVIGNVAGLVSGYLSNKIFVGKSCNLIRKIIGVLVQFGVTKVVAQNHEVIKSFGQFILNYFQGKKETNSKSVGSKN
jgi:hypothetical protein